MTPKRLKTLRTSLHRIIQHRVESGDMIVDSGGPSPRDEYDRCGCLLGTVAGYNDRSGMSYLGVAKEKLGITEEEAQSLENGFEGWNHRPSDPELYCLGEEVRKNYVEYPS